jgi:hypothetical protein
MHRAVVILAPAKSRPTAPTWWRCRVVPAAAHTIFCFGDPLHPMPLGRRREPFEYREWIFELNMTGSGRCSSSAWSIRGSCSARPTRSPGSRKLALFIDRELDVQAVLDGEVVCFDSDGRPRFYELMFGRGDPAFVVFDVLAHEVGISRGRISKGWR